jgi:glycosyltransferase involved in cell wall biosynthesis
MKRFRQIVIITAVYPPEPQITARMSFDLACYLSEEHCSVTVVCPQPSRPLMANYDEYLGNNAPIVRVENGVTVVRLPSFSAPQSRLLARMWESFSFGREVAKYLADKSKKPDVLYVNSWPLLAQGIIVRFAKKYSVPMVLQVMDIYPEALTSKLPLFWRVLIYSPLKMLDAWIAGSAATVVVISENMRRTYIENRQIPVESVTTIVTWQDEVLFENSVLRSVCCSRYGVSSKPFTFLFLGNIGPVAGVDFLIRAFAEADMADTQLLIVGDGAAKLDCVKLVRQLNLSGVHFISDPDAANVPILQGMAHVCMLPMKRGMAMSSIPSKLPSYLFSGKPVIATVDLNSDTAHFVQQAECGWVGESEDLIWLVNKMREVSVLPTEQLEFFGKNGKKFGLMHFSKSSGVVRLANTVLRAAGVNV